MTIGLLAVAAPAQAAALGKLAQAPVPPAPGLNPALLAAAPLGYPLLGLGGLALKGGLILSLVALPFIKAPEREAPSPAGGDTMDIMSPEVNEEALPEAEGADRSRSGEIPRPTLWYEEE